MSRPPVILRLSAWDGLLAFLALVHGALLLLLPAAPVVGIGLWWNSNTISHNFIHNPFFRRRPLNLLFSLYLTALLGIPQSLWRERHLAHHAGRSVKLRERFLLGIEVALVLSVWSLLLALEPRFFLAAYLPGYGLGLLLCALHGHYEHARGTESHYGRAYNLLFVNDGYHIEHHRHPGVHWTRLPELRRSADGASRWPAVLRWLDSGYLESLERLVLRWRPLQKFCLARHEGAIRSLLPEIGPVTRVAIVGGGLFPRTALILRRLMPEARLVIIDRSSESIARARPLVDESVEFIREAYDPARHSGFDLVVVPLAYAGDRGSIYRRPAAPSVLVHDWIWRPRGTGAVVSLLLLKRLNLVRA